MLLLLIGVGGYAFVRHILEQGVKQAELKWEEERRAAEAEANRKVTEAATKAEGEPQAKAAQEAEASRKLEEAKKQQASPKAEQEAAQRAQYSALISQGTANAKNYADDKAIAAFSEAIRLDPNAATAFYERANVYRNRSDFVRAIADYNEAIRIDPKNASAFSERCSAYWNITDLDKAIADCNEAIRLDSKNASAFTDRGIAFANKGAFDQAINDYDLAISGDPKYARAFLVRGIDFQRTAIATGAGPITMRQFGWVTKPFRSIPMTFASL